MPIDIAVRKDRKGNDMAFIQAINDTDNVKLIVFSSVWKKSEIKENSLLLIKGKKDKGNLIVNSAEPI